MNRSNNCRTQIWFVLCIALLLGAGLAPSQSTGKRPVIIIPGITGSKLENPRTGKTVWFNVKRDKEDDLRLPMTSTILAQNKDSLEATDIIRTIGLGLPLIPDIEVYQTVIDALEARGYKEADWKHPKAADVYYVFAYDWRRDNVESAHLLMSKITAAKAAMRRPDLKFDILAHSMGGLVARYAAMYGMADLPREGAKPVPNWSGAAHIGKLLMFGTPNEGSMSSLDAITNGYPIIAERKLPFVDDLRPEDVLTSPSIFELLPHGASNRFLDENLQPIQVDIYNPETWNKYGWGAINDPKFLSKLRDAARLAETNKDIKPVKLKKDANLDDKLIARTTYAQIKAYFATVLNRARRFHQALDVAVDKAPIQIYAYGGNCQPTLDAAVLVRDDKKDKWQTLFSSRDIKTADNKIIKKDDVKAAIYALGDGRVTQHSLLTTAEPVKNGGDTVPTGTLFPLTATFFGCVSHTKLFLDKPIQDSFLSALVVEKKGQP